MTAAFYSQLHVLIVDDFNSFRQTLNKIMRELGFRYVDHAKTGDEALKACKKNYYDLIFCDYNLGKGKNGQQVLDELRKDKRIRAQDIFIVLSAETSRNVVMSAYDCEPDAYLTKPISTKTIEQRLKRLLNKRNELLDIYTTLNKADKNTAIAQLEQKVAEESRYSTDCQKLLTELYIETQQFEKAEDICRKTLEVRALEWAQVGLARIQLAKGNTEKTIEWLQNIIQAKPSCMKAYDTLVQAYQCIDNQEQLQQVFEQAVEISPMSLKRQLSLAEVAMSNGDAEIAANAYRKTLRYGANTAYLNTENQMDFAKSAVRFFERNPSKANDIAQEAMRILSILDDKDEVIPDVKVLAKIYSSQILALQKLYKKSQEVIDPILNDLKKKEKVSPDIEIEIINSHIYNQQFDIAFMKSKELLKKYSDNQAVLEKIDYLMSEPVSEKAKAILQKENRKGIKLYKAKNNSAAIACFNRLEKKYPRFTAVKLNLVQAMIGQMKTVGQDPITIKQCTEILDFIKIYIKGGDIHFQRCQQLQSTLAAMLINNGVK